MALDRPDFLESTAGEWMNEIGWMKKSLWLKQLATSLIEKGKHVSTPPTHVGGFPVVCGTLLESVYLNDLSPDVCILEVHLS